jgi:hypothetical protein
MKFFILLLLVQLILIETRFIEFHQTFKKGPKLVKSFQKNVDGMVKIFQEKLDQDELYYEDLLGFALLVLEIIKRRAHSLSLTPDVYWYSRKG